MRDAYSEDGVDRKAEDCFSAFAGEICRSTYDNSDYIEVRSDAAGHFRGPRMFRLRNLPVDCWFDAGADGIGTMSILAVAGQKYRDAASHLVAMTFGDMTRHGRLPLMLLTNQLDVETLGLAGSQTRRACQELFYGLKVLADQHRFVVYKGETAQMGVCVGSSISDAHLKFNWSGTVFGAAHPEKEITGDTLRPDYKIIALQERGFRGCGLSSVREALGRRFGRKYWKSPEAGEAIFAATAPAVLYDRFLTTAHGWFSGDFQPMIRMHAIVHLSGGSFKSKLAQDVLFPRGLSADLRNLYIPPQVMRDCALWRGMSDEECYATWNGGQGVLVVVESQKDAERLIVLAKGFGIEAQRCGFIFSFGSRSDTTLFLFP
ncbi:MAG: hypothetical protein HY221_00595 [Candidatus Sungbacteria bacterium]|uniref:Phosphoribosylformylglycinamidine cyclo-ligase n=1 Tax=Candidatus Sungiibacteriota bacterium TaxID=2750080 RepID=A0A932VPF8_9BACT|nr:hypothetical protein [Candidatus Sungbacteria bacterium]